MEWKCPLQSVLLLDTVHVSWVRHTGYTDLIWFVGKISLSRKPSTFISHSSWWGRVAFVTAWQKKSQIFSHYSAIPSQLGDCSTATRNKTKERKGRDALWVVYTFSCACACRSSPKIPEAFLLSLTGIYLSSVITYSLMYNTLCGLDGGEWDREHEDRAEGGKMYNLAYFLPFPIFGWALPACSHPHCHTRT